METETLQRTMQLLTENLQRTMQLLTENLQHTMQLLTENLQHTMQLIIENLQNTMQLFFLLFLLLKKLVMQGWERAINTLSVRTPKPPNTNP